MKGHTILITGGTSGIGYHLAIALQADNTVIITGRSAERLELAREAGLIAIACDLTQRTEIESLIVRIEQDFPDLDVLVNNAGIQHNYDFREEPDAFNRIQQEVATNLTGTMQLTHLLLPLLSTRPSEILNVSSGLGLAPKSNGLIYSASKAGLRNATRGLRKILKDSQIVVREIIPPVTATAMTEGRDEKMVSPEEMSKLIVRQWSGGKRLIAPTKIRMLMWIDRFWPALADRIIA